MYLRIQCLLHSMTGHCVNMYELEGKLMKSVGSNGNGEAQFNSPYGIDVSDRNHNIYVCDYGNNRIQILTEELKYHSMLGIGLFTSPRGTLRYHKTECWC